MDKKIYTVLFTVNHDNELFGVGSPISLIDSDAEQLLAVKAIKLAPEQITLPDTLDEALRLAAIVAAIGQLDKENPDLWLKDGKPDLAAIVEITGWQVSADERNAAWASLQVV